GTGGTIKGSRRWTLDWNKVLGRLFGSWGRRVRRRRNSWPGRRRWLDSRRDYRFACAAAQANAQIALAQVDFAQIMSAHQADQVFDRPYVEGTGNIGGFFRHRVHPFKTHSLQIASL